MREQKNNTLAHPSCSAGDDFAVGRRAKKGSPLTCRQGAPGCAGPGSIDWACRLVSSAELWAHDGARRRSTALHCSDASFTPLHARQQRAERAFRQCVYHEKYGLLARTEMLEFSSRGSAPHPAENLFSLYKLFPMHILGGARLLPAGSFRTI